RLASHSCQQRRLRSAKLAQLESWFAARGNAFLWFLLFLEPSQRALHLRFGVDEKVCTRNHAFVALKTTFHLVDVAILGTEFDNARFKFPFALVNEDDAARASRHHGADRNGERRT